MTKQNRKQTRLLKEFEKTPLIERACQKVGIARSTYYRWCESDPKFKRQASISQEKGRAKFNDFAESKLLENVKNNQQPAIAYWLSHNTVRYRRPDKYYQAYQNEQARHDLWFYADVLNKIIDVLGVELFHKVVEQPDNESLIEEIEHAYRQFLIDRGPKLGKRRLPLHRDVFIEYPDAEDFV